MAARVAPCASEDFVHGYVAGPGFEEALARELQGVGLHPRSPWPGAVLVDEPAPDLPDPAFARQTLPAVEVAEGGSVAALVRGAFDRIADQLDQPGPWVLHAAATDPVSAELSSRALLVAEGLQRRIRELRRRAWRRRVLVEDLPPGALPPPDLFVVQALLAARSVLLVSCARPRALGQQGGVDIDFRSPAGLRPVPDDPSAPSSAYRKAEEAYLLLGRTPAPGERCVDLGGAPGGWTWTALRRGARVLAIDRAPLDPPCSGHAALEERRGDAFRFEPAPGQVPYDWLLCDVAAAPPRTCALLDRWLEERWCRRFVVNVKFTGDERLPGLTLLRDVLARRRPATARIKHLVHDKNEVTALGLVET